METRLSLLRGMPGSKKLLARYGERLIGVHYVYDETRGRRLTTLEFAIDEASWRGCPRRNDHDLVGVRIAWEETHLRIAVKKAGGIRRPRQKLWELSWAAVRAPGYRASRAQRLSTAPHAAARHIAADCPIYR